MHICAHHPVTVCHSRLLLSRPSLRRPLASINAWTLYARTAARRWARIGCALRRPCAQRPTAAKSASKQAVGAGWKARSGSVVSSVERCLCKVRGPHGERTGMEELERRPWLAAFPLPMQGPQRANGNSKCALCGSPTGTRSRGLPSLR